MRVCEAAARNGATSFSAAPLFLQPCAQRVFLPFLEQRFPHLVRRYRERFEKSAYLKGHYPEMIAERVKKIRARHKMMDRPAPEWPVSPVSVDQHGSVSHFTSQSESSIIVPIWLPSGAFAQRALNRFPCRLTRWTICGSFAKPWSAPARSPPCPAGEASRWAQAR